MSTVVIKKAITSRLWSSEKSGQMETRPFMFEPRHRTSSEEEVDSDTAPGHGHGSKVRLRLGKRDWISMKKSSSSSSFGARVHDPCR